MTEQNASALDPQYIEEHKNESRVNEIITTSIACSLVAYIAVALRLVARRMVNFGIGLDDWAVCIALAVYTSLLIYFALATQWGLGKHAIMVTNAGAFAKTMIACGVIFPVAIACVKFSILLLYSRLFLLTHRYLRTPIVAMATFITTWAITFGFGTIFRCVPIHSQWNASIKGQCIAYGKFVLIGGIFNIITDFVILALPIPIIWSLKMKKRRRVLIILALISGSFACIAGIVRLTYAHTVNSTDDPSWDNVSHAIWSCIEVCIGIVAICVPTYRPILDRFSKAADPGN